MNYHIETMKVGRAEIPCIIFDDEHRALNIFFNGDAKEFENEIKEQLDQVLSGKRRRIECSGNESSWRIGKRHTLIVNSFANEGKASEVTVDTAELRRLIDEWDRVRKNFREERGNP